jgi:D-alanyl-D-alanine dipeptidase
MRCNRVGHRYPAQLWAAVLCLLTPIPQKAGAQSLLPPNFVYLRDVDPGIAQDIRYAGADNFVGRPLPGYDAAECVLRREAAMALKQVQADLSNGSLALKVYDCYRPARASRAMAQWASSSRDDGASKRFYPKLRKENLFALGYIAAYSKHSTGTAIDLTLIDTSRAPVASFDAAAAYGPCTGPAAQRAPDNSVDMGTGYDCFDGKSHTASAAVSAEQRRFRNLLVAAMAKRGFGNYHREWWHYTFRGGAPSSYFDFPIRPRPAMPPG